MNAAKTTLTRVFEADIQFQVPIYQRTYDWTKENIQQLFYDIVKAGQDKERYHFIGAITCVPLGGGIGEVQRYQIIDGQQRIASLMLLLRALRDVLDGSKVTDQEISRHLFNTDKRRGGKDYYKTVLLDDDDKTFREIMENGTTNRKNNIAASFRAFSKLLKGHKPDSVWYGIQRLNAVMITIDKNDDAQAIFESMNSTGLDLSPTDMIQNYMLVANDPEKQERIYNECWLPMEKKFGGNGKEFDEFFRCYLMKECGEFIAKANVYREFKRHMKDKKRDEEIREIERHAKYYQVMRNPQGHELRAGIENIKRQGTNVANPFLLRLIADYGERRIGEGDAQKVLQLVDSYLVRSCVYGTLKSGNRFFPALTKRIDEKMYAKSVEKALMSRAETRRFPSDEKFRSDLEHFQLYRNSDACKYVLFRLEHEDGKERIEWDDIQIEHIMPQTLNDGWRADLGKGWRETHDVYVNTIGNLTLTGYNPELGNKRFTEKREMYKESRLKMNESIALNERWNRDEILKRTRSLADKAVELWKRPPESDDVVEDDVEKESDNEKEFLEWMSMPNLWRALKKDILSSCTGATFRMNQQYGTIRIPAGGKRRGLLVCELHPQKSKIDLRYDFKKTGKTTQPQEFEKYIPPECNANDWYFTVASEDDVEEAVMLAKAIWENKQNKLD